MHGENKRIPCYFQGFWSKIHKLCTSNRISDTEFDGILKLDFIYFDGNYGKSGRSQRVSLEYSKDLKSSAKWDNGVVSLKWFEGFENKGDFIETTRTKYIASKHW